MIKTKTLEAGLVGWRNQLAKKIEKPVSKRTPLSTRQIGAILGGLFFVGSALYVGRVVRRAVAEQR
jgi:hypothetical protein